MEQRRPPKSKQGNRSRLLLAVIAVVLTVIASTVWVLARYVWQPSARESAIRSQAFYFTTALTGDPKMTLDSSTGKTAYENQQTDEQWSLYGGREHQINIQVRNWLDELRISTQDITYTISLSATRLAEDGSTVALSDDEVAALCQLSAVGHDAVGETHSLPATVDDQNEPTENQEDWALTVYSEAQAQYTEGTVITITLQSVTPYTDTVVLQFELYTTEPLLSFRVLDHSTYLEMVLMSKSEADGIVLYWPSGISIDNTDELTIQETFEQQEITQEEDGTYTMAISRALRSGESVSIYFFKDEGKTDPQDYSTDGADVAIGMARPLPYLIGAYRSTGD